MASTSSSLNRWRDVVRRRLLITACVMALWGIAIEARLIQLQVFRHDMLVERALRQRSRTIDTHPKRGEIVDREGRVLAYSVDADTIVAVPADVDDPVETARLLCGVLECRDKQRDLIQTRLDQPRRLFAYVQRHVSVDTARRVRELDLKGIGFLKQNRRFYPNRELAAHLIGYVGIDNQGLHGLESSYDKEISGRPGRVLMQTDARNRAFSRVERPPTAGVTLELTIDKYIQYIAERELRVAVREHHAAGGSVVIMNPATGEILALANEPTFNPNTFSLSDAAVRRNRATQDVYEPGSTFKIVTASAALEEGVFHPDQTIDVSPGVVRFGSHRIEDVRNYGVLSFADVIVKSSNVGASKISVELGPGELGRARLGRAARGEAAPGLGRRRVRWTGFPSRRGHPIGDDKLSAFVRRLGIAAVRPGFGSSLRNWASERTDDRREVIEAALADVVRNPDRGGLRAVGLVRALRPADGWTGCGACTGGAGRVRLRWRPIEPTSRLSAQVVAAADPPVVLYDHSSGW